ncbi:glycosyltransferase [Candidatus Pacearchaeota archaeon]|nr:glycosyltransferase [Candidatus Pacearchaeota archaeon]
MKLSIIMPMYNSEDIEKNIHAAINSLNEVTKDYEIILVNDGSVNNCFQEAKKLENKKLKVVGYNKNKGKGSAIKYGFKFVKGNYVAFVDSGGDINPKQLKKFMKIIEQENADIVIGSKRHPNSKVHYPLLRRVMSRTYQTLNNILFNLEVQDTQVGIKLFKKNVLKKIMPKIAIKRFAFDLELLVLASKYNFKIVNAPVIIKHKFESTINLSAVFWMLLDTAAIFYRLKILKYYNKKA